MSRKERKANHINRVNNIAKMMMARLTSDMKYNSDKAFSAIWTKFNYWANGYVIVHPQESELYKEAIRLVTAAVKLSLKGKPEESQVA